LATKELVVASQPTALSPTSFFTKEYFTKNNMTVASHPPYFPDLAHCDFSISLIEDIATLTQLRR
jgi:hypothetical protein